MVIKHFLARHVATTAAVTLNARGSCGGEKAESNVG